MATTKKKAKPTEHSLSRAKDNSPFFTLRITHQTTYWLILCLLILGLGIWILTLNIRVQSIYDEIDRTNTTQIHTKFEKN